MLESRDKPCGFKSLQSATQWSEFFRVLLSSCSASEQCTSGMIEVERKPQDEGVENVRETGGILSPVAFWGPKCREFNSLCLAQRRRGWL